MPAKAQDASGLAELQEALEVLGFPELPADPNVVLQAFRRLSLRVHPDKPGGNAALFAKLVAAKDLVLVKIEESLRRGEDEISKAAGCLKWLKCQCHTCVPLILKCGTCLGCIREAGPHKCGVLSTASGRFGQAGRAFIFKAIAHDGSSEMEGIAAWERRQEKEKACPRELGKLQTADRKHQLKMA
ncbi:unnamed protein product [Symbiodinium natans]|uniref:J domain-containing protein n=1 Tax=Symbiodinium natans TaxID=878477 RepID=A0A812NV16_9DINO|nr:unnamed protein product [Symbiodinium natans]